MRQTNVCLNRVFKFYVNLRKIYIPRAHANFCARAMKIKKKIKNDGRFIQGDQGDKSTKRNY